MEAIYLTPWAGYEADVPNNDSREIRGEYLGLNAIAAAELRSMPKLTIIHTLQRDQHRTGKELFLELDRIEREDLVNLRISSIMSTGGNELLYCLYLQRYLAVEHFPSSDTRLSIPIGFVVTEAPGDEDEDEDEDDEQQIFYRLPEAR